jgi:hypothetical protein
MSLKGKKVYGFEYDVDMFPGFNKSMRPYIGQIGTIESEGLHDVKIRFDNGNYWFYPKSQIIKHLVDQEYFPTLTEGIPYKVSDDNVNWCKGNVIAKLADGTYLTDNLVTWKYAKYL